MDSGKLWGIYYILTFKKRFRVLSEKGRYSTRMYYQDADNFVNAFGGQVVVDFNSKKNLLP